MPSIDDIVGGSAGGTDEVEIDFSGAVEFEPLTGEFEAKILKVTPGASKSGNPKIEWVFGITAPEQFAGRQRTRHTPTTGKGSGLTKQVMKAAGLVTEGEKVRFRPSEAIGKDVLLIMGIQKDNSEFDEIKRVNPPKAPSSQLG